MTSGSSFLKLLYILRKRSSDGYVKSKTNYWFTESRLKFFTRIPCTDDIMHVSFITIELGKRRQRAQNKRSWMKATVYFLNYINNDHIFFMMIGITFFPEIHIWFRVTLHCCILLLHLWLEIADLLNVKISNDVIYSMSYFTLCTLYFTVTSLTW